MCSEVEVLAFEPGAQSSRRHVPIGGGDSAVFGEGARLKVRKNVYIKITPTRIELSLGSAGGGEILSQTFSHEIWEHAWSAQLQPLDETLQSLVAKAGAEGARATVVYESPSSVVEVQSNSAIGKSALLAATLSVRDASSFNLKTDPSAFVQIARDESGEPKRTHILCAMDSANNTRMVVEFVERGGLRVDTLTPALSLTLRGSVRAVQEMKTAEPTAVLWYGDHHAAFAVASAGCVHYVRSIDLGVERLMEAMTSPIIRAGSGNDSDVTLTIGEARDIFHRMGVPEYDQVVDDARGLHGSDLLPLIQPVLQRLVIEIKQSIRFGVPESKRDHIRLLLMGPGASIPGLAQVIADEAELDLINPNHVGREISWTPMDDLDAAAKLASQINLLPPSAVATRVIHRVRKGMMAGIAVGLMLLAADAGWTLWAARALDSRISALDPIAQLVEQRQTEYDNAAGELILAQQTIDNITKQLTSQANWSAWLAEMARLTPPEIQLTRLSGSYQKNNPSAEVTGLVNVASAEQTRDLITEYLASLRSCPLVESVELGAVERNGVSTEATHGFRIAIRLVAVPVTCSFEEKGS
jgi:Tfp pilus assembly protein PilN/Tfp pilus assembly PilM family ATPase